MDQILPIILPQARDAIVILGFIAIDIATACGEEELAKRYQSAILANYEYARQFGEDLIK